MSRFSPTVNPPQSPVEDYDKGNEWFLSGAKRTNAGPIIDRYLVPADMNLVPHNGFLRRDESNMQELPLIPSPSPQTAAYHPLQLWEHEHHMSTVRNRAWKRNYSSMD